MKVACAICAEGIERTDEDPLSVLVESKGRDADEALQQFLAHAACLRRVLHDDVPLGWGN